jgi:hypothetical protein
MFIRQRNETRSQRYGGGERECAGNCKDRPRYYPRYGVGAYVKGRTFLEGCPLRPICPLKNPRKQLRKGGHMKVDQQDGKWVALDDDGKVLETFEHQDAAFDYVERSARGLARDRMGR